MSPDLNTIIIPQLPLVVDPLLQGSQIINGNNADNFKTSISVCYNVLSKYIPTTNDQRQQKYAKLNELRGRIEEFAKTFSSHTQLVKSYQIRINKQMKHLRRDFQTNSHWLEMTVHRSHFVETTPDITKSPEIKINPYNTQATLDAVSKLTRGFEKLRVLHHLKTAISNELAKFEKDEETSDDLKDKKKNLKDSLQKVLNFAEFKISLEEKFLALKQITWRDKDAAHTKEMQLMIDPSGKGQIIYFLQKMESMKFLSSALCMLLKDRYYNSPNNSPLEILLKWPTDHNQTAKYSDQNRKKFVQELLLLQPNFDDLFMQLIFDYLGNFFDPTGMLRCRCIVEDITMTDAKKSQAFAQIITSMSRFNLNGIGLIPNLTFNNASFKELGKNISLPQDFEKKISSKEMILYAKSLKAEAIQCFLQFDLTSYMKNPKKFNDFYLPLDRFHSSFKNYFEEIVNQSKNSDIVLQNLTVLASTLANNGEYNFSFVLYLFLNNPNTAHTEKKEFKFLENLFRPHNNMGNMRKFFTARVNAGELCIPWLAFINQECLVLAEQIDRIRQKHQNELLEILGDHASTLFKLLLDNRKIDESLEDWADSHLFDNWELLLEKVNTLKNQPVLHSKLKASLEELLQAETELNLEIEKRKWQIHSTYYAFKIFYKDYQTAPAMQKVINEIKASKK